MSLTIMVESSVRSSSGSTLKRAWAGGRGFPCRGDGASGRRAGCLRNGQGDANTGNLLRDDKGPPGGTRGAYLDSRASDDVVQAQQAGPASAQRGRSGAGRPQVI